MYQIIKVDGNSKYLKKMLFQLQSLFLSQYMTIGTQVYIYVFILKMESERDGLIDSQPVVLETGPRLDDAT